MSSLSPLLHFFYFCPLLCLISFSPSPPPLSLSVFFTSFISSSSLHPFLPPFLRSFNSLLPHSLCSPPVFSLSPLPQLSVFPLFPFFPPFFLFLHLFSSIFFYLRSIHSDLKRLPSALPSPNLFLISFLSQYFPFTVLFSSTPFFSSSLSPLVLFTIVSAILFLCHPGGGRNTRRGKEGVREGGRQIEMEGGRAWDFHCTHQDSIRGMVYILSCRVWGFLRGRADRANWEKTEWSEGWWKTLW